MAFKDKPIMDKWANVALLSPCINTYQDLFFLTSSSNLSAMQRMRPYGSSLPEGEKTTRLMEQAVHVEWSTICIPT